MPTDDLLDDNYVAALLEQDAKNLKGMFTQSSNSLAK
jgi:hypothetical protein